ncbi:MAG: DNA repair protein RadC [Saprospiraceae bacterium]
MVTKSKYIQSASGIKSWAEEDRPREKLLLKGRDALSNAELLAILIGSGSREETALGLGQRILQSVENDLQQLGRRNIKDLMEFKGIGEAKAINIAAAMELGRRRQLTAIKERPTIRSSKDAYNVIAHTIVDLPHEEFWVLLLNRANQVIAKEQISKGGVAGTVVDGKIIFKVAIQELASSIILCHNHPSGNLKPSQADIDITKKLRKAGTALDISVLDHLIVSDKGYYSFADEGAF